MLVLKTVSSERGARPIGLSDLTIYGVHPWATGLVMNLRLSTVAAEVEQTIEGAATIKLTVRDPSRGLLNSDLVRYRSLLILDDVRYRLVRVSRQGNALELIFEVSIAYILRQYDAPFKANRDNWTRAQFVERLVKEPRDVRIPYRIPEKNVRQPIGANPG